VPEGACRKARTGRRAQRAGKPVTGLGTWTVQAPQPQQPPGIVEVAHRDEVVPALLTALPAPPG